MASPLETETALQKQKEDDLAEAQEKMAKILNEMHACEWLRRWLRQPVNEPCHAHQHIAHQEMPITIDDEIVTVLALPENTHIKTSILAANYTINNDILRNAVTNILIGRAVGGN